MARHDGIWHRSSSITFHPRVRPGEYETRHLNVTGGLGPR